MMWLCTVLGRYENERAVDSRRCLYLKYTSGGASEELWSAVNGGQFIGKPAVDARALRVSPVTSPFASYFAQLCERGSGFCSHYTSLYRPPTRHPNNQSRQTTQKMSPVPTSTSVLESALIPAHLSQVWHLMYVPPPGHPAQPTQQANTAPKQAPGLPQLLVRHQVQRGGQGNLPGDGHRALDLQGRDRAGGQAGGAQRRFSLFSR